MSNLLTTSAFLALLRRHGSLPLVFRAGGEAVPPGYHLTEVKRVSYETMDCGAMTHRWSETHFELWVPPLNAVTPGRAFMPAEKFLRIIDRVEQELPLVGDARARIHASLAGGPAALYDIASVAVGDDGIRVELAPDRTRCKAAERRVGQVTGGCCGAGGDAPDEASPACCVAEPAGTREKSGCCA